MRSILVSYRGKKKKNGMLIDSEAAPPMRGWVLIGSAAMFTAGAWRGAGSSLRLQGGKLFGSVYGLC